MKIIIWALSGIGDALMFTPALKLLKKTHPNAVVDVVVMYKGSYDLFVNNPNINNVIHFDFLKQGVLKSLAFMLSVMSKYDVSINVYPSNRKEYNLINFLTFAKKRAGVKYLRKDFVNLGFLNNYRILENDAKHNVVENIDLVNKVLGIEVDYNTPLEFYTDNIAKEFANEFFAKINQDKIVIGIHPGCSTLKNHENRRWETSKFAELIKKLITKFDAQVLLFGGPDEIKLRDEIKNLVNHNNCINANTSNLGTTFELIKGCDYFITNDSSLMHVASAAKVFVFPIIGPTNLNYIHPWQTEYIPITLNLECSPCFYYSPKPLTCSRLDKQYKCIKDLSVDFAYDIIEKNIELRGKRCQR